MARNVSEAFAQIDAAHRLDPNVITPPGASSPVPYELHYAEKMTTYLNKLSPDASTVLQLAVRAQHFRRWEVPRDSYPMTKVGYHSWRTYLKKRQAKLVATILTDCGFSETDVQRASAMIRKDGLKQGDAEVQVLEDVACLVFLDDQFEEFKDKHDEDKIVTIVAKTWGKMSQQGRDMALDMRMDSESRRLVEKAVATT